MGKGDLGDKRKLVVNDVEGEAMLRTAEMTSERDYLGLELIGRSRGLRTGEVFGVDKKVHYTRWVDKFEHSKGRETVESVTHLPGIQVEDLREGQVWVRRKGGRIKRLDLPDWLYQRLVKFAQGKKGKLFNFRERQSEYLAKKYAQLAGVQDWALMTPHRWRHYYITRAIDKHGLAPAQHLAGHSSWRTTLRYYDEPPPDKMRKLVESMSPS